MARIGRFPAATRQRNPFRQRRLVRQCVLDESRGVGKAVGGVFSWETAPLRRGQNDGEIPHAMQSRGVFRHQRSTCRGGAHDPRSQRMRGSEEGSGRPVAGLHFGETAELRRGPRDGERLQSALPPAVCEKRYQSGVKLQY